MGMHHFTSWSANVLPTVILSNSFHSFLCARVATSFCFRQKMRYQHYDAVDDAGLPANPMSQPNFAQRQSWQDRRNMMNGGNGNGSYYWEDCYSRSTVVKATSRFREGGGGRFRGEERGSGSRTHIYQEYRHWCDARKQHPFATQTFVLVSYNILADKNVWEHWRDLYNHIPWKFMNWERRKFKLLQELSRWSPDIMCLQEVDQFEDLREELERRGYCGTYKGRTGMASDGCAIFWRVKRFCLRTEENIEFKEFGLRDNVAQLCVLQRIDKETASSTASPVQTLNPGNSASNCIVVCNIHVLFNPKRGDIKLGQVRILLESANLLSAKWDGAPVVVAGDFNSTPRSPLYQYVATSQLNLANLNRQNISGQIEAGEAGNTLQRSRMGPGAFRRTNWNGQVEQAGEENFIPPVHAAHASALTSILSSSDSQVVTSSTSSTTYESILESSNTPSNSWIWTPEELKAATGSEDCTALSHNLKLRSAYSQIQGKINCRDSLGEPLVTTYHRKFMGTVDYIWHTEGLDTVRVLDTLPVHVLQSTAGLPSQKWGSDHLALACELAFLSSSLQQG